MDRSTGSPLRFVNTHLDERNAANRLRSIELLLAWVDLSVPTIVLGDLNATPKRQPELFAALADAGLVAALPDDGRGTAHDFRGGTDHRRLDHVFVSWHWTVLDAGVVDDGRGRGYPSDHWPVRARLRLRRAERRGRRATRADRPGPLPQRRRHDRDRGGGTSAPAPAGRSGCRTGASSRSPISARPPPITTTSGSRTLTRLATPRATHQRELVEHGQGSGVAGLGGGGDVLAPHRFGVAVGQGDDGLGPPGLGGVAGQPAEARPRREPLPAPRRPHGHTGPRGRRPCGRPRRRSRWPPLEGAAADEPGADAGAEGDDEGVAGAGGRPDSGPRPRWRWWRRCRR